MAKTPKSLENIMIIFEENPIPKQTAELLRYIASLYWEENSSTGQNEKTEAI